MPQIPDPPPQVARVQAVELPGLRSLLAIVVGVVVVAALYVGRDVLIPITLAVLLSFVLAPLVALLRRLWLGKVPAVMLAALLALGAMIVLGGLIGAQIASLAADAPRYAVTVERKLDAVRAVTLGQLSSVLERISSGLDGAAQTPSEAAAGVNDVAPIPVEVREASPSPFEIARRILSPVVSPLATAAIVFVVAIFVLIQREDLRDRLIRLAGATDLHRTTTALDDAARRLSRYFLTQFAINTVYGVVTWLVLLTVGVPGALLWGILAGLMRFLPYIGTPIAAIPPLLLAAAVDPGWTMALLVATYFAVAEAAMGYVVEPLTFGQSTGLSPASVIVAAIFWSWIWGPIGLILAMPLTLCLVVLGRHVDRLEFLDILLGDRPALSPSKSFYQRMLAGDPDEALDQAEALLKTQSLTCYYDDVVLKGLQLAAIDASRGALPRDRLDAVRDSARSVVSDLVTHADAPVEDAANARLAVGRAEALPPEWQNPRAVLCIAGRGPLDEVAAGMLAQLLGRRSIGAELVRHGEVARDRIGRLDITGARLVCVSYLEITGNPAHLRYLIRRLRTRLPGAPILVGLWPKQEAALADRSVQAAMGADHYVSSLGDAVTVCLAAACRGADRPLAVQ
jgi:predicted PurR-regulated permease PerM